MLATSSLLGSTLRSVREAHDLNVRELARRAEVSHTQISRIETGAVASPSREVVVRLAQALDRNPAPLLILAGHFRDDRARLVLGPMFRPGAELPEAWLENAALPLADAVALVRDPRSTQADLMRVAAGVFEVAESDETLWDPSHSQYLTAGDDDDELELLGIWRYVRGERRSDFLRYGRALRDLEDLDYLASRDTMELQASVTTFRGVPTSPSRFDREDLEAAGFAGFVAVKSLEKGCLKVPDSPGVYVVLRFGDAEVAFLEQSVGGAFKGRNPTLPIERLTTEWVRETPAVYVGSAGNLRRRIDELVRFGRGEPIGHWGGRVLWQIADHDELVVAWQIAEDPVGREAALLTAFREQHGRLPFANLRMVNR